LNILVLVCDAMRARNLGCYGYDKDTSPCMDRIADQGVLFKNAFSSINTTDPSFTTIFTGKYPLVHGLRHHGPQVTDVEKSYTSRLRFLPEVLRENGYVTIGLDWLGKWHRTGYDYYAGCRNYPANNGLADSQNETGASINEQERDKPLIRFLARQLIRFSAMQGKCNWYYRLPAGMRDIIRSYAIRLSGVARSGFSRGRLPIVSDSAGLSDLAIRYIKEYANRKNFFLFVHYWDTHIPYTGPSSIAGEYFRKYRYSSERVSSVLKEMSGTRATKLVKKSVRGTLPKTIGRIMAQYDASVTYTDHNIGRIYTALESLGILDDTLIVLTADHGESLNEHRIYFDHHGLYEPQIHVPLIIRHPEVGSGAVYQQFVQHFDIMPTVLDLAGIGYKDGEFNGESLLNLVKSRKWDRRFVYAEEIACQQKRMIRDNKYKYIKALNDQKCYYCRRYHSRGDEFYDLEADPLEQNNIIDDPKHVFYKNALDEYAASCKPVEPGKEVKFEDEEAVNQRLRSLGYF